jgi:hypothetical protein
MPLYICQGFGFFPFFKPFYQIASAIQNIRYSPYRYVVEELGEMKNWEEQIWAVLNYGSLLDEQRNALRGWTISLCRSSSKSKLACLHDLKRIAVAVEKSSELYTGHDIDAFFSSTPLSDCQHNNNTVTFKRFFKWIGKRRLLRTWNRKTSILRYRTKRASSK